MRLARVVTIEDLRQLARRRLPRAVFDYLDGGAESETTLRANIRAFETLTFRPRGAIAVPSVDLRTTVLGMDLALPFLLAPLGSSRLFYPRGEIEAARAAGDAGTGYVLSTVSGCRLEEVKAASRGPVCYQLYLVGGREVARSALERARAVGMTALFVTIDTAVAGHRERDTRNGVKELLSGRLWTMAPFLPQVVARPRWLAAFLADGGLMKFPNVVLPGAGPMPYADVTAALAESVVTWADIPWIRDIWRGPLAIKGVMTAEDACRAVEVGADAVVVSNHGGRQLDGVASTLSVLPEVVEAVGSRLEVIFDGGIRRGRDIAAALCLGARAVLVGRAYGYGLGAAGRAGVARAMEILATDLARTLKLLGCASPGELGPRYVERSSGRG